MAGCAKRTAAALLPLFLCASSAAVADNSCPPWHPPSFSGPTERVRLADATYAVPKTFGDVATRGLDMVPGKVEISFQLLLPDFRRNPTGLIYADADMQKRFFGTVGYEPGMRPAPEPQVLAKQWLRTFHATEKDAQDFGPDYRVYRPKRALDEVYIAKADALPEFFTCSNPDTHPPTGHMGCTIVRRFGNNLFLTFFIDRAQAEQTRLLYCHLGTLLDSFRVKP